MEAVMVRSCEVFLAIDGNKLEEGLWKFVIMPDGALLITNMRWHAMAVFCHENSGQTTPTDAQLKDVEDRWCQKIPVAGQFGILDGEGEFCVLDWKSTGLCSPKPNTKEQETIIAAITKAIADHPEIITG